MKRRIEMMTKLALLGAGTMGYGMAQRLLDNGYSVEVWNRTAAPAARLAEYGATAHAEPAEAVAAAQVLLTMLPTGDAVTEVVLDQGDAGYGLMLSIAGLGAITGSLLIKPSVARLSVTRVFGLAVLITGLTFFPYAAVRWFPLTLLIAFVQTATFVMGQVMSDTIVQQTVPERLRGRVFGLVQIVRNATTLLAVAVFGLLVDGIGVTPLLQAAGVPFALAGVYALWTMRGPRFTATVTGPQVTAE